MTLDVEDRNQGLLSEDNKTDFRNSLISLWTEKRTNQNCWCWNLFALHKAILFRGKGKLLPWDKGKATCLGGSLHKSDITGKSKATNTGAYTVIKGEHINKVQAAEDKSYGLIKNPQ